MFSIENTVNGLVLIMGDNYLEQERNVGFNLTKAEDGTIINASTYTMDNTLSDLRSKSGEPFGQVLNYMLVLGYMYEASMDNHKLWVLLELQEDLINRYLREVCTNLGVEQPLTMSMGDLFVYVETTKEPLEISPNIEIVHLTTKGGKHAVDIVIGEDFVEVKQLNSYNRFIIKNESIRGLGRHTKLRLVYFLLLVMGVNYKNNQVFLTDRKVEGDDLTKVVEGARIVAPVELGHLFNK